MDDEDQIMHPIDAELLSSEEEFEYPSDPQPSTSFFTTPEILLNSCRYHNLFLQQFAPSQIPQTTIELALQYLTTPLLQLAETEGLIDPQLISSEYSNIITPLSVQSLSTGSHLVPELLNSLAWDQWLSSLATSLTPAQWQLYWMNYLALFGTLGLPQHLVNFFATAATSNVPSSSNLLSSLQTTANWTLFRQQFYGMHFLF